MLAAIARGDREIMAFIQGLDAAGQLMVIPVLAITGASLDARSEEADELLGAWSCSAWPISPP